MTQETLGWRAGLASRFELIALQETRSTHFKALQRHWNELEDLERKLDGLLLMHEKLRMYLDHKERNGKTFFDLDGEFQVKVADRETEKAIRYWQEKIRQEPSVDILKRRIENIRALMCTAQWWARKCHIFFVYDLNELESKSCR